jgi:hypothetical protein
MTADLRSPPGHASPCTLASPDVPTCSSIPGRWPRLSPLLDRSLPATFLKNFPVLPWTQPAHLRSYDSELVLPFARWFSPPSSIFHWPSVSYIYSGFPARRLRLTDRLTVGRNVTLTLTRRLFCLPPAYLLVLAEIISSTLKMEAICSSETSVVTQQITRHHIPEDDTLYIYVSRYRTERRRIFWTE